VTFYEVHATVEDSHFVLVGNETYHSTVISKPVSKMYKEYTGILFLPLRITHTNIDII